MAIWQRSVDGPVIVRVVCLKEIWVEGDGLVTCNCDASLDGCGFCADRNICAIMPNYRGGVVIYPNKRVSVLLFDCVAL